MIYHEFDIAPDIFRITKSYIKDFEANMSLNLDYKDFVVLEEYVFPSVIFIKGNRNGNVFSINIKFNALELDGVSKMSFKYNAEKYKISNLIK